MPEKAAFRLIIAALLPALACAGTAGGSTYGGGPDAGWGSGGAGINPAGGSGNTTTGGATGLRSCTLGMARVTGVGDSKYAGNLDTALTT